MPCGDNKSVRDKILKTLQEIEKAEGVWEQNENWENQKITFQYGLKTKFASIPRNTGRSLVKLVLREKPKIIFEIGSSVGYSTLWLASAAEEINASILTTEINPTRRELAEKHFEMAEVKNHVTILPKDAHEVIQELGNGNVQLDMVFLDAFKKEYLTYIEELYPILAGNGTIIIDNINSHANLLSNLLEKTSNDLRFSREKIEQDNGILILRKVS